ncbi:Valine--tRNA ligase [Caulifigura coniformis]|uniref:Valine--tRNA ligase n=1 Tax=Caulifigura coniformis TaxID=2527983 RepID=A0A517SLS6_9PLAN|nr:valine--tRNA ligase [Caulifigura coniformis]QDT57074.1 Valine--tRNA ligase [Caulifigura coniformis]
MPIDLPKQYDPQAAQEKWYPFWEREGFFNADPDAEKSPHTIMIPLPNVTGALHMGHALNGTVQDLITRWRRMQGYEALWMPGTDHAGIATQSVVERRMLEEEGKTRHDVGREALVERIWKWKDVYEARILGQLKQMGASCDWRRTRFTLDEVCSRAVRRTFFKMFKDGLIFRGRRLVNWDAFLQTAVADDEVYDEEVDGHFWTMNYPVVDDAGKPTGDRISFSTTRPETMLGDTAVCVHPTDERYLHLIGRMVMQPLNGRLIPVIADALLADKELGTGCVKVTPAHDPNDYACYQRNPQIGLINILNPNGTINAAAAEGGPGAGVDATKYVGLDRYKVRDIAVADMEALGHFEKVEDRKIPLKHSDRSKTPVEPYLSEQWFVRMGDDESGKPGLAQSAMDAVADGRVRFFPPRYTKTYMDWLAEKRDWCISRQLWWGHRIPVWTASIIPKADDPRSKEFFTVYEGLGFSAPQIDLAGGRIQLHGSETACGEMLLDVNTGEMKFSICVADGNAEIESQLESVGFTQDPDVLDTWFSSALWPHATLGWPDEQNDPPLDPNVVAQQSPTHHPLPTTHSNSVLPYFYPGSVLVTSRDIITLWVARMVLTGLYNLQQVPFKHVCVHPKILDGFGQGMSKSKGNGVDPIELIGRYGCDGTRFTIASFAGETQDVRLPVAYECPHCQAAIPQTLGHLKFKPGKPKIKCAKCKKESQYATPHYEPDAGEPVARIVIERFEYGRNFCNKLWNAARFAIMNLEGYTPGDVTADQLELEDRWILSRLASVQQEIDTSLGRYQLDSATRAVREFVWNEFCDWYLEMIKPRLRTEPGTTNPARETAQRVLLAVLDTIVRLLQPFTPFICEELWQTLNELAPTRALPHGDASTVLTPRLAESAVIAAQWPSPPTSWQDAALEKRFARLQDTIIAVRNVRAVYSIPPATPIKLLMRSSDDVASDLQNVSSQFDNLAKAVLTAAGASVVRPAAAASFTLGDADGYIPLEGLIDKDAELARQKKQAEQIKKLIATNESKLANENFVSKAPVEIVTGLREQLATQQTQLANIEAIIKDLGG